MCRLLGNARTIHHARNPDREVACFARLDSEIRSHIDAKLGWHAGDPAVMAAKAEVGIRLSAAIAKNRMLTTHEDELY